MNNGSSPSNIFFYIRRVSGVILLLALAATFFYSAYTKSGIQFHGFRALANDNAFDSFQWTFLDLGINSVLAAGIIARLLIGMELLLGLFLLFHIFLRAFTYNAVIAVLSVFILYLIMVLLKQGNTGNCGCFGNALEMTPMQAIWKNVAMIAVTIVLKKIYPVNPYKKNRYRVLLYIILCSLVLLSLTAFLIIMQITGMYAIIAAALGLFCLIYFAAMYNHRENISLLFTASCSLLLITAFCTPFLINRIFTGTDPEVWKKPINLDPLYKYSPAPNTDLRKGKHIIAFMSLTCPHCKKAAYLLQIIHHQHPDIPMYIILDGPEPYKQQFFDETHAQNVPYLYFRHSQDFMDMAGPIVPSIYWVNNSFIEYKSTYAYYQLDPGYMEQWLHK